MSTHPNRETPHAPIRMEVGCTARVFVRADSYLQVVRGVVVWHEVPHGPFDAMLPTRHRLVEGEGHHATHGTWLYLHALTVTELVMHPPAPQVRQGTQLARWMSTRIGAPFIGSLQRLRCLWRQRAGPRT